MTEEEIKDLQSKKAIAKYKRRLVLDVLGSIFAIVIVTVATLAWLSATRKVGGNGDIASMESNGSLFIVHGNEVNNTDNVEGCFTVADSFSGNLYPISTSDLSNWWYVSEWEHHKAVKYAGANITQSDSDHPDRGNYTNGEKIYTAYNKADYTVFSTEDTTMDVYFDTNSISVTSSKENGQKPKHLMEAIRVGIAVDGVMKLIYSPVAEVGQGNSKNTGADVYYSVTGTNATDVSANSNVFDNFNSDRNMSQWIAVQDPVTGIYSATDQTKLFTTDHDGNLVSVYVWIEGTDAQAMVGKSDSANGVSVSVNLVGIQK